jgi:hypothetical protein
MVDHVKPDPKFELIGSDGLFSGLRHLRYGTGQDDPMPFTLTLTPQYVARETAIRRASSLLNNLAAERRRHSGRGLVRGGNSGWRRRWRWDLLKDFAVGGKDFLVGGL